VLQRQRDGHRNLIHRVLDVLGAFTPERPEMTLTSISRHTDLPLATVHRLVGELVQWGALERGEDGCYRLTVKIWQLCAATPGIGELSRAAMPRLSDLHHMTGQQAQLSILDGTDAVVIASIDGGFGADPAGPLRQAAHMTGAGLVLLAHAPRQVQEQVVAARPLAPTGSDGPSQATLRRVLADVRHRGVAACRNHLSGRTLIAGGVRGPSSSVVAAVAVTACPLGELRQLIAAVLAAANDISIKIGYRNGAQVQPLFRGSSVPEQRRRSERAASTTISAAE
jgi:DNA-binding IclR family transcriptional regulator